MADPRGNFDYISEPKATITNIPGDVKHKSSI